MISAVIDACVLYSNLLRDFLLHLAHDDQILPFWTEEIHDEWIRNVLKKRPELKEKLARTRRKMDTHFPNSLVRGYELLIPTHQLPDIKDRHVLAAAIHARAKYIVTFNLTDFPQSALQFCGIEALSPDDFVLRIIQSRANRVLVMVKRHRAGLVRPSLSAAEYLAMLEKQGLPKTVAFLREHLSDI
jgi:predicted nucleic acid-binding protein